MLAWLLWPVWIIAHYLNKATPKNKENLTWYFIRFFLSFLTIQKNKQFDKQPHNILRKTVSSRIEKMKFHMPCKTNKPHICKNVYKYSVFFPFYFCSKNFPSHFGWSNKVICFALFCVHYSQLIYLDFFFSNNNGCTKFTSRYIFHIYIHRTYLYICIYTNIM